MSINHCSAEELQFALQLGQAAGIHQMPIDNPETEGINLVDEEAGIIEQLGIVNEFNSLESITDKVSFLMGKANELYGSEQFQKAVDVAQYILQYLDADSQEAKDLLSKAKEALVAVTSETINGVAADVSGKLGSIAGQEATE